MVDDATAGTSRTTADRGDRTFPEAGTRAPAGGRAQLPGVQTDSIRIVEVSARDGLQIEPTIVPTETKVDMIGQLAAAGLRTIEATSFVSPKWVPQLADAAQVLARLEPVAQSGVDLPVLVPNQRGLDRALAAGAQSIAVFASATESFAQRNWNSDLAGVLAMASPVITEAKRRGLPVRGYLSMCWGDPWEGPTDPARVAELAAQLVRLGCDEVSLGDTIGVATAGVVVRLVRAVVTAGVEVDRIALHFHDTYGQALSNVQAGLGEQVRTFDASAGGLGGCPYAKSATGNLATEDLVWFCDGLGLRTGVDLDRLVRLSEQLAGVLGRPSPSAVVRALAGAG
ncbi:hydroxymethylglutaryl-CoA lyase [Naumannella halotolerans]|uniref:hydroxymethylglutaryl-CoA lyase n=1 Tax=Naumannella halotolerans TaxID=993414 RepID=UPI00370DD73F